MKEQHIALAIVILFLVSMLYAFYKAVKASNQAICPHKNKSTYVESTAAGVEVTTIRCLDCGKKLTDPKTEVR